MRRLFFALALAALLPTSAQDDRKPYFSLSSNRTYLPGEKPSVQMWSQNVDSLEFRVYRVKDPVEFFRKLEDVHRFGSGETPPPNPKLTWIERFHGFKAKTRGRVQSLLRAQYGDDTRALIRGWMAERRRQPAPKAAKVASFATLPLLNPQQVVSVWRQATAGVKHRWESLTVPVEVEGKGLYLVEAAHQDLRAYTVVAVTELAVVTKTAPGRITAWTVNSKTSEPIPGVPLLVWSNKQELARPSTDSNGLVEVRISEQSPDNVRVLARSGEDFAINALYSWNLGEDEERQTTGYVYTDRPIYRPGHTVHWKGILRHQTAAGYQLPNARQVQVEINDPEGKSVYRQDAALSQSGAVSGDFSLPPAAALGYYNLQISLGSGSVNAGFHVEEYKKPEYEVRVTIDKRRLTQGEAAKATISARYFFGEPVKNAKVMWVVHRARYWFPLYAAEEDLSEEEMQESYSPGEQVAEQNGHLDADGLLTVTIPTEVGAQAWDVRYRVEARVTDAGNREIAGAGSFVATRGSFLVHIRAAQYVYQPRDKAKFTVETRDYDGRPVPAAVRVELREHRKNEDAVRQTTQVQTDASGSGSVELEIPGGGSYTARAVARTPEGRDVEASTWIWVTGSAAWWQDRGERIEIVADKRSYKPGEAAKVLIATGVPEARVLVTIEGRDLYSRQLVAAKSPSITVDIPIRPEYLPNVYVSAAFVRDNKLYEGSKKLNVPAARQKLQVEVQPSKKEYKPGEPAMYTVTARDSEGQPVAAEFSLGVVDEAIYALRPDSAPDIFKFFWGSAPNRVGTQSSLNYYFHGEAGKRRMQLTHMRSRKNLAQLKPEQLVQPRVRKAFPDTAYWVASLTTDASGRGTARFDFPDALTTWRATARAITRDTKAGAAIDKTIVRKNLMLRLAAPRFFTQGDEVTLSVLVHNYLKTEKTARVSLDVEGLEIVDGATRDIRIPSGGDARLDWRVRAKAVSEAKLLGKALTDEESDAMEITLPVNPFGVKLAKAEAGSIAAPTGEKTVELSFPARIEPSSRMIELSVTPSAAGAIFGALEYLVSFPYGCTEQTMSSFVPNIVVSQALKELHVPAKVDPAALEKKIRAGLDRLYDFQHEDGGWGWWQTDESHPFMTAYVVAGLSQAQAAGYTLRDGVVGRGQDWLRGQLDQNRKLSPDLRAYALYAIGQAGGLPDKARLDSAWQQRSQLSPYGLALLGLALQKAGDARAAEAALQIESQARSDERDAYWPVERDTLMDFYGDTTAEATAHALKLLARARPQSPLIEKAAFWLISHRDQGYYWNSTKQTAMVIYGLIDYLKASGELRPNFSVAVSVNGKQVLSRTFTAADALAPNTPVIRLPADQLAAGANTVRIAKNGEGRLYWSARAEYYSTEDKLGRSGSAALNLSREYFKLVPVKEGTRIVHQLEPLEGPLHPGDVVVVRLVLTGGSWRYLLVEDPIPAGAEFIDNDELYPLKNRPPWWQSFYARREFHDDHAALFQTYFGGSQTAYHLYLLKVVNPGTFRVSPARVQPMYQPSYLATTESKVLEVR
ncbi:MAG: alpha-2-macroglobulin [Acidobacteria bacterium]|nr:alpha-2-macroglobulin [Acidobacteriota bacterium]